MIRMDGIEIAESGIEYGIQWADGSQTWDLSEEDCRVMAWSDDHATLLVRRYFVTTPEVAE